MPHLTETPAGSLAGVSGNQLGGCLLELSIPEGSHEQVIPSLIEIHLGSEFLLARQGGCACAT